jgi:hypothetical protein
MYDLVGLIPSYSSVDPYVTVEPFSGYKMLASSAPALSSYDVPSELVFLATLVGGYKALARALGYDDDVRKIISLVRRIRSATRTTLLLDTQIREWRQQVMEPFDFGGSPDELLKDPSVTEQEWHRTWVDALSRSKFR